MKGSRTNVRPSSRVRRLPIEVKLFVVHVLSGAINSHQLPQQPGRDEHRAFETRGHPPPPALAVGESTTLEGSVRCVRQAELSACGVQTRHRPCSGESPMYIFLCLGHTRIPLPRVSSDAIHVR